MNHVVSVVLPAYNAKETVQRAIDSIIAQTFTNWHLYLVDDGSTDGSQELFVKYASNPRISIIVHAFNVGVSEARNSALAFVREGQFVAFCDADDFWEPDHLSKSLWFIEQHKGDFVYSDVHLRDPQGNEMFRNFIQAPSDFKRINLYKGNFIHISSVVCRTKVVEAVGKFKTEFNGLEDYDYWCRAAFNNSFKFLYLPEKTATYLVRTDGNAGAGGPEKEQRIRDQFPPLEKFREQYQLVYDEIFEGNYYNCFKEDVEGKTVIDIGGNYGFFAILCAMYGAKKVVTYEASPKTFQTLLENVAPYPQIVAVNKAVMHEDGLKLHITDNKGGSQINSSTGFPTESVSLQTIVDEYDDGSLVMKMDVEGAEYDILFKSPAEVVNSFTLVYIELHDFYGGDRADVNTTRRRLDECGFSQTVRIELIAFDIMPDGSHQRVRPTGTFVEKWTRARTFIKKKRKLPDIKVLVVTVCYNDVEMVPHFLNHYQRIAHKILVVDGGSTDGSVDLMRYHPKVEVIVKPSERLNDRELTDIRNNAWKPFKDDYDWVICVDIDEFVDCPGRSVLAEYTELGMTTLKTVGYQMVSEQFPYDYSRPILEQVKTGFVDKQWLNKLFMFNPKAVDVRYEVGCLVAHVDGRVASPPKPLCMYHFKYVGLEYLRRRSDRNFARLSGENLEHNWGWHYKLHSGMTQDEFKTLLARATEVR